MAHFPDARSVAYLRKYHYRSVVIFKDQSAIPAYARVNPDVIPAPSLGLQRIDMGDSVLYEVEPAAGDSSLPDQASLSAPCISRA